MGYRVIDHTADLGLDIEAVDLGDLFAEAARGFANCITRIGRVEVRRQVSVNVISDDLGSLLVDFLSELLYLFETEGLLFSTVDARVAEHPRGWEIEASVGGEVFDTGRHPLKVPIKAITYHQLHLTRSDDGWTARVIFDI
jgi:SHS2 domain-containing protein